MVNSRPITFHSTELHDGPFPSFINGFKDDAERLVAGAVVDWAASNRFRFRHSRSIRGVVEYIVVPDTLYPRNARIGEPLLTLQQYNRVWDIPFGRMRGLALNARCQKQRLFDALNAVLPSGYRLKSSGLDVGADGRSWSQLPYLALMSQQTRESFCKVLSWAAEGMRKGSLSNF